MGRKKGGSREKTTELIMEATLKCLARTGHKKTTFASIASEAGLSSAIVVQHFKEVENIFPYAFEYFMVGAQEKTADALNLVKLPYEKLREYIAVSFNIVFGSPDGGRVYLMVYYFGIFDQKVKFTHNQVKTIAVNRVES